MRLHAGKFTRSESWIRYESAIIVNRLENGWELVGCCLRKGCYIDRVEEASIASALEQGLICQVADRPVRFERGGERPRAELE